MKLRCPECSHENEPERIYCHECGTKLDRSALMKAAAANAASGEKPQDAQRRLKKIFDPTRARIRQHGFTVAKLILGAVATAAVIQLLVAPEVPTKRASAFPPQINLELENVMQRRAGDRLSYTEDDVNAYLAYALAGKKKNLDHRMVKFERATVQLDEGVCTLTAQRTLFGLPVFTSTRNSVAAKDGKLSVVSHGGKIGRLAIHPKVMAYADALFGDLWKALEREKRLMSQLAAIEFHPDATVLIGPQPQAAPAPPPGQGS